MYVRNGAIMFPTGVRSEVPHAEDILLGEVRALPVSSYSLP